MAVQQYDAESIKTDMSEIDLEDAFNQFNTLSQQLSVSYQQLEQRTRSLQHELSLNKNELETIKKVRLDELIAKEGLANHLEHLLKVLPAGVIVLDHNGVVEKANPASRKVLGHPLVGERWFELVDLLFQPRADDGCEVSLKNGRKISLATSSLHEGDFTSRQAPQEINASKQGSSNFEENKQEKVPTNGGQLILVSDLSETRRLQSLVNQKSRLSELGKVIASLSHQLRTPLSAAVLYCGRLKQSNLDEQTRITLADKLMDRLKNMEAQVANMLQFTAIGNQLVEELSIGAFMEVLDAEVDSLLLRQNKAVNILVSPTLVFDGSVSQEEKNKVLAGNQSIYLNRVSLTTALINMIENAQQSCFNAMESSSEEKTMSVNVYGKYVGKSLVDIVVEDNGLGINEDLKDKIGESFFTTKSQGNGLGLQVVKAVANAHGGKMIFASHPNIKTRFVLRLPLSKSKNTVLSPSNDVRIGREEDEVVPSYILEKQVAEEKFASL